MAIEPNRNIHGRVDGPHRMEEEKPSKQPFLSRLSSFFKRDSSKKETEGAFHGRPISHVSQDDLKEKATLILSQLEEEKKFLILSGGHLAEAFALRHVEPVLAPLRRFIDRTSKGLSCRLADVEIVTSLYKEDQVRYKICENVQHQTRQVIAEDIAFVSSLPSEVLGEAHIATQQRVLVLEDMQQKIGPLIEELKGLISKEDAPSSLVAMYRWRTQIDQSRQQLQDMALSLIEDTVRMWRKSGDLFYRAPLSDQLAYITKIFGSISSSDFEWPKSLFELEEASYFLTRLVETQKSLCLDQRVVNLVRELREDIDVLFETANRSQYHDILLGVMEHLRSIEDQMAVARSEEDIETPEVLP
jgi:hypothetical protein